MLIVFLLLRLIFVIEVYFFCVDVLFSYFVYSIRREKDLVFKSLPMCQRVRQFRLLLHQSVFRKGKHNSYSSRKF